MNKNRYYPAIFCVAENKYIAVSKIPLLRDPITKKFPKVTAEQWQEAEWLNYHKIEMNQFKNGEKVFCPFCKSIVDFRLWISATIPRIIND